MPRRRTAAYSFRRRRLVCMCCVLQFSVAPRLKSVGAAVCVRVRARQVLGTSAVDSFISLNAKYLPSPSVALLLPLLVLFCYFRFFSLYFTLRWIVCFFFLSVVSLLYTQRPQQQCAFFFIFVCIFVFRFSSLCLFHTGTFLQSVWWFRRNKNGSIIFFFASASMFESVACSIVPSVVISFLLFQ